MNILIVIAHPEPQSMNHAIAGVMRDRFKSHGWNVVESDLYAQRFPAAPSPTDFTVLHSPDRFSLAHEQRYAQKNKTYRKDILLEQDRIRDADLIVFQFPLWWYAVPSILKGWAERVLSNGFAYDDDHMFDTGLLKGKRAMLSLTTGGTRSELDADQDHTGTVEQFLKPFTGGVLEFCGMSVEDPIIMYAVSQMSTAQRQSFFDTVRDRVDHLVKTMNAGSGMEHREQAGEVEYA